MEQISKPSGLDRVARLIKIEAGEGRASLISFSIFFFLLCGYYILRPIRDSMAITGGVDNIQWLFTATFVGVLLIVPLFGWACAHLRRAVLISSVYGIVIVTLTLFYVLFWQYPDNTWIARGFYIWVSIFNLMMLSVFWSLMADVFNSEQSHRLFSFIAAGGSLGALMGPLISALLVVQIGHQQLILISIICFIVVVALVLLLLKDVQLQSAKPTHGLPMPGNPLAGFSLIVKTPYLLAYSLFLLLLSAISTFLYFQQAQLMSELLPDAQSRTQLFAWIDVSVSGLSIFCQLLVTGNIVKRFGVAIILTLSPILLMLGFISFALHPLLSVVIATGMIRRVGAYAFIRPCREMLFTHLDREVKYKAKNFIDTVVYRGGDTVSSWFYAACVSSGLTLVGTAVIGAIIAAITGAVGYLLGKKHEHG